MQGDSGRIVAGLDIGNSTTEVVLMRHTPDGARYLGGASAPTTGVKGTAENVTGCLDALDEALRQAGLEYRDVVQLRVNEAAPVISDLSMDTVSETVIIGSAMIGHNPDTPGGEGLAVGRTVGIMELPGQPGPVVAVIGGSIPYYRAAQLINSAMENGVEVVAAIAYHDDGVLINNRLNRKIPIVDEVKLIEKVPLGVRAAVEVARKGESVRTLSNPYGIAGLFGFDPQQTKNSIPVARSLTGCASGVVIYAENARVDTYQVKAGIISIQGNRGVRTVEVNSGAEHIMKTVDAAGEILDVEGERETNVGSLLNRVRQSMADLTGQPAGDMKIVDLLACDTFAAVEVAGGIAGESAMENVVMLAAMVKTSRLLMDVIAKELAARTGIFVKIAGREAEMALKGALTTPGADIPLAILDLGGGSTDAALIDRDGKVTAVHQAGAGEMVTKIIDLELDLHDRDLAEQIKKYPLAKVEGLLYLRFEDGSVKFASEPLPPSLFSRVVVVAGEELIPIRSSKRLTMERIALVRREAKKKVFLVNARRALQVVAPEHEIRNIGSVALVGGSSQDFEIGDILAEYLSGWRIAAGRANLLGFLEPHSAVALGLALG